MLQGYKTYIVASAGALYAAVAYLVGGMNFDQVAPILVTSGASAALRAGIHGVVPLIVEQVIDQLLDRADAAKGAGKTGA